MFVLHRMLGISSKSGALALSMRDAWPSQLLVDSSSISGLSPTRTMDHQCRSSHQPSRRQSIKDQPMSATHRSLIYPFNPVRRRHFLRGSPSKNWLLGVGSIVSACAAMLTCFLAGRAYWFRRRLDYSEMQVIPPCSWHKSDSQSMAVPTVTHITAGIRFTRPEAFPSLCVDKLLQPDMEARR
jgi:hypothetical protein